MINSKLATLSLGIALSLSAAAGYLVDDDIVPSPVNQVLVGCKLFNEIYERSDTSASGFAEFTYARDNGELTHSSPYSPYASGSSNTFSFVYSGQKNFVNNGWISTANKWRIITNNKDIVAGSGQLRRCLTHTASNLLRFDTCNVPLGQYENISWQSRDFFLRNLSAAPADIAIFTDSGKVLVANPFYAINAEQNSLLGVGDKWIISGCTNKWGQPVNPAAFNRYFDRGVGNGPN